MTHFRSPARAAALLVALVLGDALAHAEDPKSLVMNVTATSAWTSSNTSVATIQVMMMGMMGRHGMGPGGGPMDRRPMGEMPPPPRPQ